MYKWTKRGSNNHISELRYNIAMCGYHNKEDSSIGSFSNGVYKPRYYVLPQGGSIRLSCALTSHTIATIKYNDVKTSFSKHYETIKSKQY